MTTLQEEAIQALEDVNDINERVCIIFHNNYEVAARITGWETQSKSRVPWTKVPEENKETMRYTLLPLISILVENLKASLKQHAVINGVRVCPICKDDKPCDYVINMAALMRNIGFFKSI